LWDPVDGKDGHDHGAHGEFGDQAHDRSEQLWMSQHAGMLAGAAACSALVGAGAVAMRWIRNR
jgi:hypothetical protein